MLEVIGAGLGRTGTHSLGRALEILGFGPCYNIREVGKNSGHDLVWSDAMDGKAVDWDSVFASYKSAVEWPAVAFLSLLVRHFSEAKVVLTLRDPESWYESANSTIFDALELSAHNPDPDKRRRMGLMRRLILERTFTGRYREKKYALTSSAVTIRLSWSCYHLSACSSTISKMDGNHCVSSWGSGFQKSRFPN